jgi:hypothetical protein
VSRGLAYYLGVSYRRKRVDADLAAASGHFSGRVLDVGGARRRGAFRPPPTARWVVADLDRAHRPHVGAATAPSTRSRPPSCSSTCRMWLARSPSADASSGPAVTS